MEAVGTRSGGRGAGCRVLRADGYQAAGRGLGRGRDGRRYRMMDAASHTSGRSGDAEMETTCPRVSDKCPLAAWRCPRRAHWIRLRRLPGLPLGLSPLLDGNASRPQFVRYTSNCRSAKSGSDTQPAHQHHAVASLAIRCTTVVPTFRFRPIFSIPIPWASCRGWLVPSPHPCAGVPSACHSSSLQSPSREQLRRGCDP